MEETQENIKTAISYPVKLALWKEAWWLVLITAEETAIDG